MDREVGRGVAERGRKGEGKLRKVEKGGRSGTPTAALGKIFLNRIPQETKNEKEKESNNY